MIALAIVALPLLRPAGPGHITPADVLMGVAIVGVVVWLGSSGIAAHLPYVVPMSVYVGAGVIAAIFSMFPESGAAATVQDIFILCWAAAIANTIRTPRSLSLVLGAWVWGAVAWASILVAAMVTHQWWLAGGPDPVSRGSLFFDDPNMAGNFFVLSFFILLLAGHPKKRVVRVGAALILLAVVVVTGSNAALLSLTLGGAATGFVTVWRRSDLVTAVALAAVVAFVIGAVAFLAIEGGVVRWIDTTSNTLVVHSIDRSGKSAEGRWNLFVEELQLYETGSVLGRGPASTLPTLRALDRVIVKAAHDDYLATLVERGPIGAIGLLLLIAGIGIRGFSLALHPLSPAFDRIARTPAALIGGIVTLAATATTHEILHYRHVWAFLGILGGLYLFARIRTPSTPVPVAFAHAS